MIHLDTNVVIALLNGKPSIVRERFDAVNTLKAKSTIAMSIVVYHELMYGAAASEKRRHNEEKIALFIATSGLSLLPFEEKHAREAADIRGYLRKLATPIGPYDVLIAAQARSTGSVLITANYREFNRVPELIVIDWTE